MDFFKSLIIDDPDPPESPRSETSDDQQEDHHQSGSDPNPNPQPQWTFGGLIKTLQVKSDWIDTYRKDLEEFGSGLKKETQIFQEVASKAVKDIPTSIDSIGSTLLKSTAEILSLDEGVDQSNAGGSSNVRKSFNLDGNGKYNRFDAQLRNIQCDVNTYVLEVDDVDDFEKWKLGFDLEGKREEIDGLMRENDVVEGIYRRVVEGGEVEDDVFWLRYYYRVFKFMEIESVRAKLVKRVNLDDDDEELSWDVDDDEESEVKVGDGWGSGSSNVGWEGGDKGKKVVEEVKMDDGLVSGSSNVTQEGGDKGKKVEEEAKVGVGSGSGSSNVSQEGGDKGKKVEEEAKMGDGLGSGSSNVTREGGDEEKKVEEEVKMSDGLGDGSSNVTRKEDDSHVKDLRGEDKERIKLVEGEVNNDQLSKKSEVQVAKEGKTEPSESGKDSDISVVSTQHSTEEDDMGWDEIEDIGSGDEKKMSHSQVSNREELRKRLSVANDDDDEDLSWGTDADD